MFRRIFCLLIVAVAVAPHAVADEGMWLPNLVASRIKDMNAKGFRLSAEDVYSINRASMKDAIVRFGGGCTGELISPEGLLITNHHCGYRQIQSHSSVEHDYLSGGFWAMSRGEELPNPGLEVTFLVRMEDVTSLVLRGVTGKMDEKRRAEIIKKNISGVVKKAVAGTHYTAAVEPFYYGNQYFLFVNEVFRDVRLVGAPPSSIGKFGGDTDNWMWPRHTGDFSLFRIYAGKDNKPAAYSKDNVPYKPKRYFAISARGVDEGDFTMVYGFPGRTTRYITSDAVRYVAERSNPAKIALRTMRLDIMKERQAQDPAVRIMYAAKHASVANAWKKWQGESGGVIRLGTVTKKEAAEAEFRAWAKGRPQYEGVLDTLHSIYGSYLDNAFASEIFRETVAACEMLRFADGIAKADTARISLFYKNYDSIIDRRTTAAMLAEYRRLLPAEVQSPVMSALVDSLGGVRAAVDFVFDNSAFGSRDRLEKALAAEGGAEALAKKDPAAVLYRSYVSAMNKAGVKGALERDGMRLASAYRTYMRGMMEKEKESASPREFFPDANSTLRYAYGKVEGYSPRDAVRYGHQATLEGIIEKDDPSVYDYNIPQRLRDLHASKDYGRWTVDGTVPVTFIASNHTTGGNSGSPVLNGRGELVGVNFDRTWESTMSDIEFDPEICRNIALDIRYALFVIDKISGAGYLFDEMTIK